MIAQTKRKKVKKHIFLSRKDCLLKKCLLWIWLYFTYEKIYNFSTNDPFYLSTQQERVIFLHFTVIRKSPQWDSMREISHVWVLSGSLVADRPLRPSFKRTRRWQTPAAARLTAVRSQARQCGSCPGAPWARPAGLSLLTRQNRPKTWHFNSATPSKSLKQRKKDKSFQKPMFPAVLPEFSRYCESQHIIPTKE